MHNFLVIVHLKGVFHRLKQGCASLVHSPFLIRLIKLTLQVYPNMSRYELNRFKKHERFHPFWRMKNPSFLLLPKKNI